MAERDGNKTQKDVFSNDTPFLTTSTFRHCLLFSKAIIWIVIKVKHIMKVNLAYPVGATTFFNNYWKK